MACGFAPHEPVRGRGGARRPPSLALPPPASLRPPLTCLLADKQTFPQLDLVGWYATGAEIEDNDMSIHRKV